MKIDEYNNQTMNFILMCIMNIIQCQKGKEININFIIQFFKMIYKHLDKSLRDSLEKIVYMKFIKSY